MNAYTEMLTELELMDHIARIEEKISSLKRMKSLYEIELSTRKTKPIDEFAIEY